MRTTIVGLLALAATVSAAVKGFNYGATFSNGAPKQQSDFEAEFSAAQKLVGAPGFTSARLYSMVQPGSVSDPIAAIPAAINTKTTLLLGLWASAGDAAFDNELAALKSAIDTYGDAFTSIVDGISVGSEDLYRISPTGMRSSPNPGAEPQVIIDYINKVKKLLSGTKLKSPVGHVDTWTAWVNSSNAAVIGACDFVGFDAYPYFQESTPPNDVTQGLRLFDEAFEATRRACGDTRILMTETGWPVSGRTLGQAKPSVENAKSYWDSVGCQRLFGKVDTWWFALQDDAPETPNPSFGILGKDLDPSKPLYDLSCSSNDGQPRGSGGEPSSTTSASITGSVTTASAPSSSASDGSYSYGSGPGSGSGSGSGSGPGCSPCSGSPTSPGTIGAPGPSSPAANATYTTGSPNPTTVVPTAAASMAHAGVPAALGFLAVVLMAWM